MTEQSKSLSKKWQNRFEIIDGLQTKSFSGLATSLKSLPFKDRLLSQLKMMSFLAFLFGPIYYLILGMWRKSLFIVGFYILIVFLTSAVFSMIYDDTAGDGQDYFSAVLKYETLAIGLICSWSVSFDYYSKIRLHDKSWTLAYLKKPISVDGAKFKHVTDEISSFPRNINPIGDDDMKALTKLHELKEKGILTQEEFDIQKKKII